MITKETTMHHQRRTMLKSAGAFGVLAALGLITHAQAIAAEAMPGFDAKNFADAVKALGGAAAESKDINLIAPEIAENGAVVPLSVSSAIPDTQAIYVFVEKNPNPLSAAFMIPAGTDPSVTTRVKMGETSRITAVVKAGGKLYTTSRETKVTLGGCGG
jgi:sulfur-oxidizing protein SoxY